MSRSESCVTYVGLPISAGGAHGMGRITSRAAAAAFSAFLETRTVPDESAWRFRLSTTPEIPVDPSIARLVATTFPGHHPEFPVPRDRVDEAIDLLEGIEPQPSSWGLVPVMLTCAVEFELVGPDGTVLPGQEPTAFGGFRTPGGVLLGRSRAHLSLGAKKTMALDLSLPGVTDTQLVELIPWFQESLPFRLSTKHWARWTLTAAGRSYRGRAIAL